MATWRPTRCACFSQYSSNAGTQYHLHLVCLPPPPAAGRLVVLDEGEEGEEEGEEGEGGVGVVAAAPAPELPRPAPSPGHRLMQRRFTVETCDVVLRDHLQELIEERGKLF